MAQWVHAMQERGHEIMLVSPNVPRVDLADVTVSSEEPGATGRGRFPARIRRLRRLAKEFGADLYHAHYATDYAFWPAVAGLRPLLVTCWGSDVLLEQPPLARLKRRYALRRAQHITATSAAALAKAREIAARETGATLIHWGVDRELFSPGASNRPEGAPFVVLSYRNLKPLYNIDVIIEAFAASFRGSDAELRVGGIGNMDCELRALADRLGIAQQVSFLGGLSQEQVVQELHRCDVYVSVPRSDASAVSNLEAMACGVAIVASDLPSTREWIQPEGNGLLVPAGEVEPLAVALLRLSAEPSLRERLGAAALATASERADRRVQMDVASALYDRLAAS